MAIDVKCDGCGKEFEVDEEYAGQTANCSNCGHEIVIPEVGEEPAPRQEAEPQAPARKPEREEEAADKFSFADETKEAPAAPPAHVEAPAPRTETQSDEAASGSPGFVRCFRIALIVAVSLAMVEIFHVGVSVIRRRERVSIRTVAAGVVTNARKVAAFAPTAGVTPAAPKAMLHVGSLPTLILAAGMFLLAFRLLLNTKLLTTLYEAPAAEDERPIGVFVLYFLISLGLVGILVWAASLLRLDVARDGMVLGLIGVWLIASCLVAFATHVIGRGRPPHMLGRIINDGVFGLLVLGFLMIGHKINSPLCRVNVVALALLLNSAFAFTISSRYVLDNEKAGRLPRRVIFMIISVAVIAVVGYLMMVFET